MANVRIWCTDITISLHNLVVWGFYNKPLATTDLNNNRGYIITVGFAEAGASLVIDRGTPEWWFKCISTIAQELSLLSRLPSDSMQSQIISKLGWGLKAWSWELGAWSLELEVPRIKLPGLQASDNLWWSNPFLSVSYEQSFRRALIIIEQLKLHILGDRHGSYDIFNFFWKTQTHMQYASHSFFRCLAYLSWS